MPIFEYQCTQCSLLNERVVLSPADPPLHMKCARCGADAKKKDYPSTIAFARSSMDNAPIDNAVGRDAERRWADIHSRQETRDKVRRETGVVGLQADGRRGFAPISDASKQTRTEANSVVSAQGGYTNVSME